MRSRKEKQPEKVSWGQHSKVLAANISLDFTCKGKQWGVIQGFIYLFLFQVYRVI